MIYLDYNATTPLKPAARDAMVAAMAIIGNPSSVHGAGRQARRVIEQARQDIAELIGCDPTFITFTSGATESNNTVLLHAPVKRVLVSAIEHPSVLDMAGALAPQREIEIIPVTSQGVIDLVALENRLAADDAPALISVMAANNETGIVQPVPDIVALARRFKALVHVDAVQWIGKTDLAWDKWHVDYLSLSAHKIGGPAGIGALVYNHEQPLLKMLQGGGQERRRRAGTENLIGIAGFGAAARAALQDRAHMDGLRAWHRVMEQSISDAVAGLVVFGTDAERLSNTTQMALPNVTAEKQLMALDLAGFAVSSGSACSSGSIKPSAVLLAMGVDPALAQCAIRVSSGWATTQDDMEQFTRAYIAMAQRLRGV